MPKVISEDEKRLTKKALQQAGIALTKSKGLRNVTVDDITKSVGMAKGSFYLYYKTREEFLYETLKISEKKIFDAMMNLNLDTGDFRESVRTALRDIYLAPDSLALYAKTEDIEHLMRKVSAETREQEQELSQNYLVQAGKLFNIQNEDLGILAYLMNALQYVASSGQDFGEKNKQRSLEILVCAIADFLSDNLAKR